MGTHLPMRPKVTQREKKNENKFKDKKLPPQHGQM